MSNYVSIRGWLECSFDDVEEMRIRVNNFSLNYDKYAVSKDSAQLYSKGWSYPSQPINWISFVFFGACVRESALEYIRDQIISASNNRDVVGIFYIDNDESEEFFIWQIKDGLIHERTREVSN